MFWWFIESLFHKYRMRPELKKWIFEPVRLSEQKKSEILLKMKTCGKSGTDEGGIINASTDSSCDQNSINRMIRVWNREPGARPHTNTFMLKSRERFKQIADRTYTYFPSLGWWLFHNFLHILFFFAMTSLGYRSKVKHGIRVWDNHVSTEHVIVFYHGLAPEGLITLIPFFYKFMFKRVRVIVPINPVTSFQCLYPNPGIIGKLNSSLVDYLADEYISAVHTIGHSAGVAGLNALELCHCERILSSVYIDPVHHVWISKESQKLFMNSYNDVLKSTLSCFWKPDKWIELCLVTLFQCPSLAGFAVEISNDAACYNFLNVDTENQLFVIGTKDSLNKHSIPTFQEKSKHCTVWVKNSYHGETLFSFEINELVEFQKMFESG